MKKMLKIVLVTWMVVLCMTGCGKEQDEFLDYVNGSEMKEIAELEKKAKDSYASVFGDNYKDDQIALTELSTKTKEDLKQLVDKAVALGNKLEGEELKKVHNEYIASVKDLQSGVEQVITALENSDSEQVTQANELLNKANEESKKYLSALNTLASDLGVELTSQEVK